MASWQSRLTALFLRMTVKRRLNPGADPATMRGRVNRLAGHLNAKAPWIRTQNVAANGVPGEWINVSDVAETSGPESQHRKILLYLHGGGYVVCSPATHRLMVARICREADLDALVIDYRLAPEHPFPAAVEDAEAAYRWLLASGYAGSDIVVAGDSAGGGLTLSLLLRLREEGLPMPAGAALLSPWTDLALTGMTMLTNARTDPMLRLDSAALAVRHYLQQTSPTNPIASPLHASLDQLPPLFVQVGENEILLDDARRLVTKALASGVDASLEVWPGMMHVFQAFPKIPEGKFAIARLGNFLKARANAANRLPAQTAQQQALASTPGEAAE